MWGKETLNVGLGNLNGITPTYVGKSLSEE